MPGPAGSRGRIRGILVDPTPLRLDHDFRWLWFGQAVNGAGNQITRLALPFQVYVLTGSVLAVGLLAFVRLVPIIVLSPFAGSLADTMDRRRLLVIAQVGQAAASLALFGLALLPAPPLPLIYAAAVVSLAFSSFDQPARSSSIPRLVPSERLPAAIALNQLNTHVQMTLGPALGGLLLATVGVAGAYAVDAVTFLVALVALGRMAPIPPTGLARRPGLAAVMEGLRFARERRIILSTFVIDLNAMILGMPTALYPVLALEVFKVGPGGVGLIAAAPGAGAVIGMLFSGWAGSVRRVGRAVVWSVVVWGLAIAGFGLATFSFPVALALLGLAGAADVISALFRSTITQLETPDELRGRVTALYVLVVRSGPAIGDIESTLLASVVGPQGAVVLGGVACALGALGVARIYPELDRHVLRREPVPIPTAPTPAGT